MRYFPVFVDLDGRDVLIAGGGEKALQKMRLLCKSNARVRLIAEVISDEAEAFATANGVSIDQRAVVPADLEDAALIFAANDDPHEDEKIIAAAKTAKALLNVVDGPRQSDFIMPAIVDRDPVVVAIGTEGTAPILAREIKAKIESWLPSNFGEVARRAMMLRQKVQGAISDPVSRRRLWEALLQGRWRTSVLSGEDEVAAQEFDRQLEAVSSGAKHAGSVALIGCGPGDPDLLTLKAQQRLQAADVLVVDRLVNPAILEYARRDAIRIDVGKEPEGPSAAQEDINRILVREALKGHRVARLKGGDAFIFGRAAEEMVAVRSAGVPVEIVPGITAAHACAASAGLPLTLRQKVRQFAVVTGQSADGNLNLDWASLANPGHAFAIYMGVRTAGQVQAKLIDAGAPPAMPVVIVENGSLPAERIVATKLGALADAINNSGIKGPAIIFVGLDWESIGLSRPDNVERYEPEQRERPQENMHFSPVPVTQG